MPCWPLLSHLCDLWADFHTLSAEESTCCLSLVFFNKISGGNGRSLLLLSLFTSCRPSFLLLSLYLSSWKTKLLNFLFSLISLILPLFLSFIRGAGGFHCSFLPLQHPPSHLWVPLCLFILLPNRSIIGALSLVNVASDTSDGSFVHVARVRRKVGARGKVKGGCLGCEGAGHGWGWHREGGAVSGVLCCFF